MEYIGTIFVAVVALVIGFAAGKLYEMYAEKEIRTLAGQLAEAVLFDWDNVADVAKNILAAISKWTRKI